MAIRRRDRNGKIESVRPSFTHAGETAQGSFNNDAAMAQLCEDTRNVLEQIRDSQMLQCDVAHAIKDIAKNLRGLRRDLKGLRK